MYIAQIDTVNGKKRSKIVEFLANYTNFGAMSLTWASETRKTFENNQTIINFT